MTCPACTHDFFPQRLPSKPDFHLSFQSGSIYTASFTGVLPLFVPVGTHGSCLVPHLAYPRECPQQCILGGPHFSQSVSYQSFPDFCVTDGSPGNPHTDCPCSQKGSLPPGPPTGASRCAFISCLLEPPSWSIFSVPTENFCFFPVNYLFFSFPRHGYFGKASGAILECPRHPSG